MSDQLLAAAREAARAFSNDVADIELIIQAENTVYRVNTDESGPFVLRLHRPGYNAPEEMASELTWLEALADDRVPVHRPMRALDGSPHVAVDVGGKEILAGAVEWLAGVELGRLLYAGELDIPHRYEQLGRVFGAVRASSMAWQPPPGFIRRSWGTADFLGDDAAWGRFWEIPPDDNDRGLFGAAREALLDDMGTWPTDQSVYGIIHADAHPYNVMVDGDELVLFDFDDCGYSWYAYELAVAFVPIRDRPFYDEARKALIEGYRSVCDLTDDDLARADTLMTVRRLIHVSWLAARPELGTDDMPESIARARRDAEAYLARRR